MTAHTLRHILPLGQSITTALPNTPDVTAEFRFREEAADGIGSVTWTYDCEGGFSVVVHAYLCHVFLEGFPDVAFDFGVLVARVLVIEVFGCGLMNLAPLFPVRFQAPLAGPGESWESERIDLRDVES